MRKTLRPKIDTGVKDQHISQEEMQMTNQHMIESFCLTTKCKWKYPGDIISPIKLTKILKWSRKDAVR